jgi:hypothetical protein
MSRPPDELSIASDFLKRLSPEFRAVLEAVVRDYECRIAELEARLVSVRMPESIAFEFAGNGGLVESRLAAACAGLQMRMWLDRRNAAPQRNDWPCGPDVLEFRRAVKPVAA